MKKRRNGLKIMASLIVLLGSLSYIMLLAIINGTLGFLCAMGVTIFGSIGVAKFLGETINMSYGLIISLTIGCGVLRGALRYLEQYSNHFIAFKLLAALRDKIFKALRVLAPAKLEGREKGGIISMITSDIETLEVFYAHTISPICIALIVETLVLLYVGFISSFYLSLAALVSYIIIGIILPIISSKLLSDTGVRYRKSFASFNSYYLDSIKGVNDIVLNNAMKVRNKEVNSKSDELLAETKKLKHKSGITEAISYAFVSLSLIGVLILGLYLSDKNITTIPKMIMGLVAIFGSYGPVIALSALPQNLTQTFASGDRVLDLLEEKPVVREIKDGKNFSFLDLKVNNLSFKYDEASVLNNVNLEVKRGQIVALVGPSGCGKSTLLKLLLRFYETNSGDILYNNISINDINTSSLLDNVTLVSQQTYLFDDTIKENIKIAKYDATDEEIIEAAKKASIHEFIESLPDKYDTKVGQLGDNLSAGEKQRIGLARAFLSNAPLILLDEPTSNVDSINEGIILKSLKDQKENKSIILVSHRESTTAIADRIYRIKDGIIL
ncbi:aBC transporter ATP-binding protein [Clostridium sp. CAG:307]|nr:aBC transporter ATP-binding protein [Clostridium sp. CAG:307]